MMPDTRAYDSIVLGAPFRFLLHAFVFLAKDFGCKNDTGHRGLRNYQTAFAIQVISGLRFFVQKTNLSAETIPGTKTDDSIELGAPLKFFLPTFSFKKK